MHYLSCLDANFICECVMVQVLASSFVSGGVSLAFIKRECMNTIPCLVIYFTKHCPLGIAMPGMFPACWLRGLIRYLLYVLYDWLYFILIFNHHYPQERHSITDSLHHRKLKILRSHPQFYLQHILWLYHFLPPLLFHFDPGFGLWTLHFSSVSLWFCMWSFSRLPVDATYIILSENDDRRLLFLFSGETISPRLSGLPVFNCRRLGERWRIRMKPRFSTTRYLLSLFSF